MLNNLAHRFPALFFPLPEFHLCTHRLLSRKGLEETLEQMSWAFLLHSSFFSTLSLKILTALASSTLSSKLSKAARLCLCCSSLFWDLEIASSRKWEGRPEGSLHYFLELLVVQFLQTAVSWYCGLFSDCWEKGEFYTSGPFIGKNLFIYFCTGSNVKFIHIGKIPPASMTSPTGFLSQNEKPWASSWSTYYA